MATSEESCKLAMNLYFDEEAIADYDFTHLDTSDERILLISHSGQYADIADSPTDGNGVELETPQILYAIFKNREALNDGDFYTDGIISTPQDRAEFLELFK